jgi:hypothetical protein
MKRLQLFLLLLLALPIGVLAAGTKWDAATTLPIGQEKSGNLSKNVTEEWWTFTVSQDGASTITVTPGSGLRISDVRLYYYEYNDKKEIVNYWQRTDNAYYTEPGWYSGYFTTPNLAPGSYLVRIQRGEGEGSYTIKCDFKANSYTNNKETDEWNNANTLTKDVAAQGHLGYGYTRSSEDNYDWWTFTVTEDGEATIIIDHEGSLRISDLRLYYFEYDKDKKVVNYWQRTNNNYYIEPGWYSGTLTINNLAPGTYLIRIERGEGQGGYQLTYTFKANGYKNNKEVDDWNAPGKLPYNSSVQGHLGYGYASSDEDNYDWWTFEVKQDGAATINITHDGTLRISDVRLYYYEYSKEKEIINYWQRTDDTYYFEPGWYAGNMRIPNLAPGIYLLRLQRGEGWGGYELTYTAEPQEFTNDPEPNNEWIEGLQNNYLARGQEKQGHLGYGYVGKNADNYDWFRITVPRDGKAILTYTPTSVNSALRVGDVRLYYIEGNNVNYWQRTSNTYYMEPGWYAASLTIPDLAPGDYLVRVERAEGYGAYSLKYEFEQNELPNDVEPNNEWNQAIKLVEGKTQSGHLGYGYVNGNEDTYDWYEVTMSSTGTLKINIQPGSNLRISDVRLYYYEYNVNHEKVNCWQRTKGNYYIEPGWYAGTLTTEGVEAGDYLIRVQRGQGYGNYRIAFNADIKDVTPLDPLPAENPDNPQEPKTVQQGGTTYTVDGEGNVTVTDVEPDGNDKWIICGYPGPNWHVRVKPDIFNNIPWKDVYIEYTTPPTLTGPISEEDVKDIILHVPAGTKEEYEKDPEWSKFKEIRDDYNGGSQTSTICLIVWMSETEKHYYGLTEKPKITMNNGDFTVTTTVTTVTYPFDKVWKFTLDENNSTAIKGLKAITEASVERLSDRVVFTGCTPKSAIRIYNMSGRLVGTQWIDDSGRAEVSISGLAAGVYVVKSDSITLKIAKR